MDESEPQTSFIPCDLPEPPDTALEILTLIQPDTTAPRLTRVHIEDSVTLRIEFDDHIEPTIPAATIRGTLTVAEWDDSLVTPVDGAGEGEAGVVGDTVGAGEVGAAGDSVAGREAGAAAEEPVPLPEPGRTVRIRIFQEHQYEAWLAFREDSIARADSIAREEEAARAAEAGDTAAPGEAADVVDQPAGQEALPGDPMLGTEEDPDSADRPTIRTTLSGLRLPVRTLVGVLDEGLVPNIPYELVVDGVANIAGADEGGGVDTLTWEPEEERGEEETEVIDSVQVDDTAAVDDTTAVPSDTVTTPPDTTTTPPDTTTTPPDTITPPDTTPSPPTPPRHPPTPRRPPTPTGSRRLDPRPRLAPRPPAAAPPPHTGAPWPPTVITAGRSRPSIASSPARGADGLPSRARPRVGDRPGFAPYWTRFARGRLPLPASDDGYADLLGREIAAAETPSLLPAVNATGVILHTNLGRAPLAPEAREAMARAGRVRQTSSSTWTPGTGVRATCTPRSWCGS